MPVAPFRSGPAPNLFFMNTTAKGSAAPVFGYRDIFMMAWPLLLSYMLEQLIGMTDVAFLGRYSEVALGAAAISTVAFVTIETLGFGYAYGLQVFVTRRFGQDRRREIGPIVMNGTYGLVLFSALLVGALVLWSMPAMRLITSNPDVAREAGLYLYWRGFGLPLAFGCAVLRAFFVGILKTRIITLSSVVMLVTNVVLNYPLIFGFGPVPAMGISGAAIASAVSEGVALLFLGGYVLLRIPLAEYGLDRAARWSGALQRELIRVGGWLSLQEVLAFGTWLYFFVCVEHIGPLALAVSNVVRQCSSALYLSIHAYGSATGALCSNLLGRGLKEEVFPTARRGLVLCALTLAPVVLLCLAAPTAVLRIFTDITDVLDASGTVMYMMLAGYIVGIPSMYYTYIISGVGAARPSFIAMTFGSVVYFFYIMGLTFNTKVLEWYWTSDWVFYGGVGLALLYYMRPKRFFDSANV